MQTIRSKFYVVKPYFVSVTREMLDNMLNISPVGATAMLWQKKTTFLSFLYSDKQFEQLMNSDEKFDLILIEAFFAQEPLFALAHKFKAPVINLQPFGAFNLVSSNHGNPLNLAYIPDFALPFSDRLSFYQRALNAYSILSTLYKFYNYYIPEQDQYMRKVFDDPSLPPLTDLIRDHLAMTFSNAHPYVHYAQPYTPNIIPIGGIHLAIERKPLPTVSNFFESTVFITLFKLMLFSF